MCAYGAMPRGLRPHLLGVEERFVGWGSQKHLFYEPVLFFFVFCRETKLLFSLSGFGSFFH